MLIFKIDMNYLNINDDINENYLLSNGQYFHFHRCDDGFDYTIYDHNGMEIDGGILEYEFITKLIVKDILKELSEFTGIKELLEKKEVIDEYIIESFEERMII